MPLEDDLIPTFSQGYAAAIKSGVRRPQGRTGFAGIGQREHAWALNGPSNRAGF